MRSAMRFSHQHTNSRNNKRETNRVNRPFERTTEGRCRPRDGAHHSVCMCAHHTHTNWAFKMSRSIADADTPRTLRKQGFLSYTLYDTKRERLAIACAISDRFPVTRRNRLTNTLVDESIVQNDTLQRPLSIFHSSALLNSRVGRGRKCRRSHRGVSGRSLLAPGRAGAPRAHTEWIFLSLFRPRLVLYGNQRHTHVRDSRNTSDS